MDSNNKISNIAVCYCLKYLTQVSYSRWVQTVHQSVLKYCLIETDPLTSTQRFRVPTFEVDISGAAEWSAPVQCNASHSATSPHLSPNLVCKVYTAPIQDVAGADVVVATLSTSRAVARLLEPGHFSHVVLDEAAQALETEAIMPLVLAAAGTR